MQFYHWHRQTMKKIPKVESETSRYFKVLVFGLGVFGTFYAYTNWLGMGGAVNKAVADASVVLIGLSMLLSSVCYFWNFADTLIIYRKHLGLVGFAFAVVHLLLSSTSLLRLLDPTAWTNGSLYPVLTALIATFIFTIMTVISNNHAARELGGVRWRGILRTGYIALIFVLLHVALLKMSRWVSWWQTGMERPPALSLIISVFILVVLIARVCLWWSLRGKK